MSETISQTIEPREEIRSGDDLLRSVAELAGATASLYMTWWPGTPAESTRIQTGELTGVAQGGEYHIPMLSMERSQILEPDASYPYIIGPGRWALPEKATITVDESKTTITWSDKNPRSPRDFALHVPIFN